MKQLSLVCIFSILILFTACTKEPEKAAPPGPYMQLESCDQVNLGKGGTLKIFSINGAGVNTFKVSLHVLADGIDNEIAWTEVNGIPQDFTGRIILSELSAELFTEMKQMAPSVQAVIDGSTGSTSSTREYLTSLDYKYDTSTHLNSGALMKGKQNALAETFFRRSDLPPPSGRSYPGQPDMEALRKRVISSSG